MQTYDQVALGCFYCNYFHSIYIHADFHVTKSGSYCILYTFILLLYNIDTCYDDQRHNSQMMAIYGDNPCRQ